MKRWITALVLMLVFAGTSFAQEKRKTEKNYPPKLPGATVEVYKTIGDVKLNAYIFYPEDHKASDRRAAIVFYFGGGWRSGTPKQFYEQCKYLASRGMVAITADYRVLTRHGTKAIACVSDGKSAVRWVRQNAKRLGVDPNRVAAGGGSAGGHVAACTGVIKGFEESGEDHKISSVPNAMALFNPAVTLIPVSGRNPLPDDKIVTIRDRVGDDPRVISPLQHVSAGAPPTIIFHGRGDKTVFYWTVEAFTDAMKKAGNRCELVGFDDMPHGFFNHGRFDNVPYNKTIEAMDKFFVSLGYLKAK